MATLKTVKLSSLKLDKTFQHRVRADGELFSREYLLTLKANIRDIGLKRAIRCIQLNHEDTNPLTGETYKLGDLLVVDGIHRTVCLREIAAEDGCSLDDVATKVDIWSGDSFRDAMILSCRSNFDNEHAHGRSLGDKSKAIDDYLAFIKADAKKTGKIIFGIEYKRIAEVADCSEESTKRHRGAREFKAECRRNRGLWFKDMASSGKSHRDIAKVSCQKCYFGAGLGHNAVSKSVEYTFGDSEKEQNSQKPSKKQKRPTSTSNSTADTFMPVDSIARSAPASKEISNLSVSPDQLIIQGLSEDEMVQCLERMAPAYRWSMIDDLIQLGRAMERAGVKFNHRLPGFSFLSNVENAEYVLISNKG